MSAAPEPGPEDHPEWLDPLVEALRDPGEVPFMTPPPDAEDVRESAVLALFGDGPNGPDILLQERAADMRSHPGQPAFPGGRIDPTDDGVVGAALREAQEETGLDPAGVVALGTLPDLWLPPSRNIVTTVVAWWREPSEVRPVNPAETAAVARVPLADLINPANRLVVTHPMGYESPAFQVADMLVWGFTAGVLTWMISLAGWEQPWDRTRTAPFPAVPGVPGPAAS